MPVPTRPRWATDADVPYLAVPKVTLHDHLDGSIHPETMIELATAQGVRLPYDDGDTLAWWFHTRDAEPAEEFPHQKFWFTTALMQDPASCERVAYEWGMEAGADGVVHGEVRWAPEKHVRDGMGMTTAVRAVAAGLAAAEQDLAAAGRPASFRQLLCGMRETDLSAAIAELTVATYDPTAPGGVTGYDIAGPEAGHPAHRHVQACRILHEAGVPYTVHTGEGDGVRSVWETVHQLHALRLGHGVRVVEDITLDGVPLEVRTAVTTVAASDAEPVLGPVARWVLDRGLPLEVCPSSNSRWVVDGVENHPVHLLAELGFAVTINPDNRMMSQVCISAELRKLTDHYGWDAARIAAAELRAADATFLPAEMRQDLRVRMTRELDALAPAAGSAA